MIKKRIISGDKNDEKLLTTIYSQMASDYMLDRFTLILFCQSMNYIIIYTAASLTVVAVYGTSSYLTNTGRLTESKRPTFLTKFIAGYIFMILASLGVLLGYFFGKFSV